MKNNIFSIIKNIALNYLILVPYIAKKAKEKHITGIMDNSLEIDKIYNTLKNNVSFKNKKIIELGPGQSAGVIKKIILENKDSLINITGYDVTDYINNIHIKKYDGINIPEQDNSVNISYSWTCLEHVRSPEKFVENLYRVMSKGGIGIHMIDLGDHYSYSDKDKKNIFNCIRFSEILWFLMTSNRSAYVNRLRKSQWVHLFEKVGFKIELISELKVKEIEDIYINKIKGFGYLYNRMSFDDACTKEIIIKIVK